MFNLHSFFVSKTDNIPHHHEHIIPTVRQSSRSILLWGCFSVAVTEAIRSKLMGRLLELSTGQPWKKILPEAVEVLMLVVNVIF